MATVTLTPSRVDPPPPYSTALARPISLQPSAMPPPPPSSVSPRRKIAMSRDLENPFLIKRERERGRAKQAGLGDELFTVRREALGNVDTNHHLLNNASTSTLTSVSRPPVPIFHTSIPKPPLVPDVFTHTGGKRPADYAPGESRKRRALDDVRVQDQRAAKESDQERWRNKWIKSFPTLTFHFDVGAQEGPGRLLKARTTKMGAKVEQFFSTKVTHLIVKNGTSPSKPKPANAQSLRNSPKNPFYDPSGGNSLAEKANALGMKVWPLKKLTDILDRLAPIGQTSAQSNSLSTLLEDEKLHGTRERDATAPRPDWYYFRPGSKYLLVEDATAKHRTVLVKEYQPQPAKTAPEYPILYDSFLKLTSSSETNLRIDELRERAWTLYVDQCAYRGEQPPARSKRSSSLLAIPGTPSVPDVQPYHHASGNSVVITSNIASTSTANHSPAFVNGVPGLGTAASRGPIMQMSKRVQVLKGNAAKRGSSSYSPIIEPPMPRAAHNGHQSSSTGRRTFMTQEQVVAMLRKQREPAEPDSSVSIEKRIRNREKVESGYKAVKEQDTASGYCENCRIRYDDLSVHLTSRKHRRFATDPANFADLDSLLKLLRRQINRNFAHDDLPFAPCWDEHTKDYPCERCVCMVGLPESECHESSTSGIEEWVHGDDEASPTSSQDEVGIVGEDDGGDDHEEEGPVFFEESAEGKEFEG